MIIPQTLKGFRDFLPADALKRQYVIDIIKQSFELFGFDPLETPALEYADVLLGKYGAEADKLLYLFEDNGGRKVGMRYDQTVPLSRVISQYQNELVFPFRRYQIQPVWRAENTQKGRFREFLQCDIDIIGSHNYFSDVEIISCTLETFKKLGFKKPHVWLNDRSIFDDLKLTKKEIIIIDKLDKIGEASVIEELKNNGRTDASSLFQRIKNAEKTEKLEKICRLLGQLGYKEGADDDFKFVPFLARGLDYYTSTIFETKILDFGYLLSCAGGGRYDKLIGSFTGHDVPAVGIAFGFDRIIEAITDLQLFSKRSSTTSVFVTVFSKELHQKSIDLLILLRKQNIHSEMSLESDIKLDKQLKYAEKKGIPFAVIIGPDEAAKNMVTLKNLADRTQTTLPVDEAVRILSSQT